MTVSTINNVAAELKRSAENQNKSTTGKSEAVKLPTGSSVPSDNVTFSVSETTLSQSEVVARVESQNREAANSTLTDGDIDTLNSISVTERVQINARQSVEAQTNKLPPSMLDLLVE